MHHHYASTPRVHRGGPCRARPLALLLLLALAPARALAEEPAPAAPQEEQEDERASAARSLYRAGRHAEAARIFEELWRDGADPGAIYNAGKAREAAGHGHEAHAILNWRRYLAAAPDLSPEDRTALEVKLIGVERRAVPVEFRYIAPPGAPTPRYIELRRPGAPPADGLRLDWTYSAPVRLYLSRGPWTLRLIGDDGLLVAQTVDVRGVGPAPLVLEIRGPDPIVPVTLHLGPEHALTRGVTLTWQGPSDQQAVDEAVTEPSRTYQLPRGSWRLRADARGYLPLTATVDASGPLALDLQLRPDLERRRRLTFTLVTGGAALALITGGAARYAVGDRDYRAALAQYEQTPQLVLDQTRRLAGGASLLASGFGVGVVSATVGAKGSNRLLLAELGIGAVLALTSAIALPLALDSPLHPASTPLEIRQFRGRAVAWTSLLGLGLGLSTTSLAAVISRALSRDRPQRARP